jgi:hypothetical protein
MRAIPLFSIVAALFFSAQLTYAHHSFDAEFDRTKLVTLTGTVTKVDWAAPHVVLHLNVNEGANPQQWTVELGAPERLTQEGWTQSSLKNGDTVTIEGWAAKSDARRANAKSVRMPGGTIVSAASSFEDTPPQRADARTALPKAATMRPVLGLTALLALVGVLVVLRLER